MGGDQAGGLALAIGLVMLLMVVGGLVLFALLGRVLARRIAPERPRLVMALTALVGAGLGWLLVIATFYESSWSPPPQLHLATAPGFDRPVVILEDPRAPLELAWQGGALPFTTARAEINVPPSGIVRVRDLGPAGGNAMLAVTWPDGRASPGAGGGPGPPGTGAISYLVVERPDVPYPGVLLAAEPPAVAAYVAKHERQP